MRTFFVVVSSLCLAFVSQSSSGVTSSDLKTARPETLLRNLYKACQQGSQEAVFSQHSKSIEQSLLRAPEENRRQILAVYCQGIREVVDKKLGGNPESATYLIKESDRTHNGKRISTLIIVPKGQSAENSRLGFDVTIENGQLKKDEF